MKKTTIISLIVQVAMATLFFWAFVHCLPRLTPNEGVYLHEGIILGDVFYYLSSVSFALYSIALSQIIADKCNLRILLASLFVLAIMFIMSIQKMSATLEHNGTWGRSRWDDSFPVVLFCIALAISSVLIIGSIYIALHKSKKLRDNALRVINAWDADSLRSDEWRNYLEAVGLQDEDLMNFLGDSRYRKDDLVTKDEIVHYIKRRGNLI